MSRFNRVSLLGAGLIGGSLALEGKNKGLFGHVVASSRRTETLDTALERGIADSATLDVVECVRGANLVVLAVPVVAMEKIAEAIAPALKSETIVTDVGSVKGRIVESIENILPYPSRFVPGHPVAGSEHFGPEAAVEGLFKGKQCILTPTKKTDPEALASVRGLWEAMGMQVVEMDPHRHDRLLATTSHLPHIVAYALVETLMNVKNTDPNVLDFTAGGFHDFTRIAASSPDMWRDIFLMNPSNLIEMIGKFTGSLDEMQKLIENRNGEGLRNRLEKARRLKEETGGKKTSR